MSTKDELQVRSAQLFGCIEQHINDRVLALSGAVQPVLTSDVTQNGVHLHQMQIT